MQRYSWMIFLAVIGAVALTGFFIFLFGDMEKIKVQKKNKLNYLLNTSLLMIAAICVTLAIYLYFDIQAQIRLFETIM